MLYGALEAGGTKMVCAIGDENGRILEQFFVPTTTPEETMPQIIQYFQGKEIEGLGIACFGPIDLHKDSETYGHILETPKLPWRNYDIVGVMEEALHIPIGFDTDVNGSLLGEVTWGSAKGLTDAVYLTIGTGVGGGILSNGKLLHGMLHPEMGHMKLARAEGDTYHGKCPYHGTCLEGLSAGPAIEDRWGKPARELADCGEVWELESDYIAQALVTLILTLSPQKIILGGGVMHQTQLFPMIRRKVAENLNGYLNTSQLQDLDSYIVPAGLNDDQGIMGAVKLAIDAKAAELQTK
ncbi:MAG: ROK family protein [Lachnospiraceae bacterium]|nr:ROK family protein [Lachnospiraceae bacterium]